MSRGGFARSKELLSDCLVHNTIVFDFVFQGSEYARRSILQDSDTYMTYYYKDAQTMYEFFLRGLRVSSKSNSCLPQVVKIKSPVVHPKKEALFVIMCDIFYIFVIYFYR